MNLKEKIESILTQFSEVMWDRWSGEQSDMSVFGWIARDDSYKDFLVLEIRKGEVSSFTTSSAKLSAEFARRLDFIHSDCQRVEKDFDVRNVIKLRAYQAPQDETTQ